MQAHELAPFVGPVNECLKTKAPSDAGGALGGAMSLPSTCARPGCPTGGFQFFIVRLFTRQDIQLSLLDWLTLRQRFQGSRRGIWLLQLVSHAWTCMRITRSGRAG